MNVSRMLVLAALATAFQAAPAPAQGDAAPGGFEVVGRGPVTVTRTAGLAVFRGVDGGTYALTGTYGDCTGCRGGKVFVWDLGDPARPVLTDSVAVDGKVVGDMVVNEAGTVAVVSRRQAESRRDGLVVLDLSEPAHPKVLADYFETVTGGVYNMTFDGTLLYVANAGTADLNVLDLSDPEAPREIGRWGLPDRRDKHLQDVAVKDGLAYLSYWDDGVVILDVGKGVRGGTPEKPVQLGTFRYRVRWLRDEYGNTSTAVPYTGREGKEYLFVGDRILPPRPNLDRPMETGGYVHVLDVSRPNNPVEVARWTVPGAGVSALRVEGDTLYAAFHNGGLRALDVSGDLRGELRGRRELAVLSTADGKGFRSELPFTLEVEPFGGLVYAADLNSGLWVARLAPSPR